MAESNKYAAGTRVFVRDECENLYTDQEIMECVIKEATPFIDKPEKTLIQLYPVDYPDMDFALSSDEENEKFFFDKEDAKMYQLVAENED